MKTTLEDYRQIVLRMRSEFTKADIDAIARETIDIDSRPSQRAHNAVMSLVTRGLVERVLLSDGRTPGVYRVKSPGDPQKMAGK